MKGLKNVGSTVGEERQRSFFSACNRRYFAAAAFFCVVMGFYRVSVAQSLTQDFVFGAFPMVATGQVEKVFSPVAAEFSRLLGKPVLLRTKPSFPLYREELRKQTYDVAIVQPFDYVLAYDQYNYLPLARFEKPLYTSFMVLPESQLRELKDLKGQRVAFPPITAAVTHMGKKAFIDAGIAFPQDVEIKYTKSHDACLQLVIVGAASACASSLRAVHVFESKWGKHFRVLQDTPSIPNSLFIVHRRVPEPERRQLLQLLTSWPGESETGKTFYQDSNNMRLVPAVDTEYDVVRQFPKHKDN